MLHIDQATLEATIGDKSRTLYYLSQRANFCFGSKRKVKFFIRFRDQDQEMEVDQFLGRPVAGHLVILGESVRLVSRFLYVIADIWERMWKRCEIRPEMLLLPEIEKLLQDHILFKPIFDLDERRHYPKKSNLTTRTYSMR